MLDQAHQHLAAAVVAGMAHLQAAAEVMVYMED
jgi:hypothetical protein